MFLYFLQKIYYIEYSLLYSYIENKLDMAVHVLSTLHSRQQINPEYYGHKNSLDTARADRVDLHHHVT